MEGTKPIWSSKTVWMALVTLLATFAGFWGYDFVAAEQQSIVDAVMAIIAALGSLGAIWGRTVATKKIGSATE